jgi:hypothetical protein
MSTNRDFDRIAGAWLAEGPSELADRVLDAALDEVHVTHQRRRPTVPWRTPAMPMPLRLAAGIAIIAVLGYAGLRFLSPSGGPGSIPSPTPSPTASPSPGPTATPAPTLIDTADWTTYASERYGFSIDHPTDWVETPSDHVWTMATDGGDWLNTAAEQFTDTTPNQGVRLSVWSVSVEAGTTWETWLESYCTANAAPCPNIQARTVAVTLDGHPGLRPTDNGDTQAFFLIDNRMYGVVIWRTDDDPSVAKYGGGIKLLEAILATMELLPGGPVETSPAPS